VKSARTNSVLKCCGWIFFLFLPLLPRQTTWQGSCIPRNVIPADSLSMTQWKKTQTGEDKTRNFLPFFFIKNIAKNIIKNKQ